MNNESKSMTERRILTREERLELAIEHYHEMSKVKPDSFPTHRAWWATRYNHLEVVNIGYNTGHSQVHSSYHPSQYPQSCDFCLTGDAPYALQKMSFASKGTYRERQYPQVPICYHCLRNLFGTIGDALDLDPDHKKELELTDEISRLTSKIKELEDKLMMEQARKNDYKGVDWSKRKFVSAVEPSESYF